MGVTAGSEISDSVSDVFLPSPVLADFASILGYRTIVVDPRRRFGNLTRFPNVDQLIQAWPDKALSDIELNRSIAVTVLTHNPKLDDPALMIALPGPAFYIRALGSQKTQAERRHRLLEAGLGESHLARLHGPIGLDIL